jgi:glutamine amidotransferase
MLPITPRGGDNRSDTRIFAEDVLGSIGVESLDDKSTFGKLEDFASGSKLAILSTAPELKYPVYILNEHLGHWDKNIWWSNSGYLTRYSYNYSSSYWGSGSAWDGDYVVGGKKNWWDSDYEDGGSTSVVDASCYVCMNTLDGDALDEQICNFCNSCLDCYEHANACLCYTPRHVLSSQQLLEIEY